MKKSRLHEDALKVLDAEIARCEQSAEYQERSKVEGFVRSKQLLLSKRREAEAKHQANGASNGKT